MQLVTGEFSADVYEIVSKKKTVVDDSAIVYANTVLMNSKLHILKFIEMVVTYWNTGAIRLLYTGLSVKQLIFLFFLCVKLLSFFTSSKDTDSFFFTLSRDFNDVVLPEKAEV